MNTDILSVQGIEKYLDPQNRQLTIQVLPEVSSTNTMLREKANEEIPEGYVIIANGQTEGRGRRGRSFYSPVDTGIYLSILLPQEGRWQVPSCGRLFKSFHELLCGI